MKDTKIFKKLTTERGKKGEDIAADFLSKKKYKILKRNFRTRNGEIDIIAKYKDYYVFVEVKFRKNNDFGKPFEFVDKKKINRMIKAIKYYFLKENLNDVDYRIDIVSITEEPNQKIEHFEDITRDLRFTQQLN